MSKKDEPQQIQPLPNIQIPEVYANAAMANISPFELEITLGLASSNYQGVKPVVNIRMSPQFMKEFSQIISENLKVYEDNYGEIKAFSKKN